MIVSPSHPDPSNDIELYRKKRRRKRKIRHLIITAVILSLTALLIFFAVKFDFSDISEQLGSNQNNQVAGDSGGFPKKLFGDHPIQFEHCGSHLVMVTDSTLYLYDGGGNTVLNSPHSYSKPTISCSDKRVLLYDRGGNNFRVNNTGGTLYEREMTNEIICGTINNSGYAAVATTEERYAGSVTVYSSQNKQVFKWYSSDGQITGLSLRDNGELAVSCITAKDGAVLSIVYLMNIGGGEEQQVASVSFPDMMVLSAKYKSNGSLAVIGDTKTVMVSGSGEVVSEYSYEKNIGNFSDSSGDYTALLLSSSANSEECEVVFLDNGAGVTGTATIDEEVKWIEASGGSVYILGENEILQYDSHMNLVNQVQVRSDSKKITVIGSNVYVLGLGEIWIAGQN